MAGDGISGPLDDRTKQALTWLEGLPGEPITASPRMMRGQAVTMFMPNDDLEKLGGDVPRVAGSAVTCLRPREFAILQGEVITRAVRGRVDLEFRQPVGGLGIFVEATHALREREVVEHQRAAGDRTSGAISVQTSRRSVPTELPRRERLRAALG